MTERSFVEEHGSEDPDPAKSEGKAPQVALEQAWSALQRCRRELRHVLAVTDAALSSLALDKMVSALLERVREFHCVDTVVLMLRAGEEWQVEAAIGTGAEAGARSPVGSAFARQVAAARRPLFLEDLEHTAPAGGGAGAPGSGSLFGAPLLLDGEVTGVLQAGTRRPRKVTDEDLRLLQLVARQAARAIRHAQAFEQTRRGEQRFQALVEATREYAIILLDPEGRVLDWNSGAEQLFQYAPEEIQGLHFSRFFTPEDLTRGQPEWELQTAAGGGQARDDSWLVRKDGARFWVTGVTTALRDETGQLWAYAKVVRDQTDQKLAEEAERCVAREIEDLYNHAPCGYHSLDAEGRFGRINDTELRWLGYDRNEVLGREFAGFLAPEHRQVFLEQFPAFKARGRVWDLELDLVRRDGSLLPVLLRSTAVYDAEGRFVMSRSTLFDMTERKRAEAATRAQQQTLVELAKNPVLTSGDLHHALTLITEASAGALNVDGAGVWLFPQGPGTLRAADYFHRGADQHSPDAELSAAASRAYLRALEAARVLAAADVRTDPGLQELWEAGFLPAGVTSVLVAPVRQAGQVVGILRHDHGGAPRNWTLEEQSLAGSVADMVAHAIEGADRRAMEEALRARSAAVESSIDGMAILDREGRFTFVNQAHAQLYGYDSPEQLLGKSWKVLYAPGELRRFEEKIMPALARAGRWCGEAEGQRQDGAVFPQEVSLTTLQDGGLICVVRDVTNRKRVEDELRFLADAGAVLNASLGYEETLQRVAQLVVSCMADICIIDMVEESGAISRVAVAHADPAKQQLAERLRQFAPDPASEATVSEALRVGAPRLMPEMSAKRLRATARNDEHLALLRELAPRSTLIQPLSARGRVLGAITLAYSQSPRRYGPEDLPLAEELGRRAAMAIDNARLYEHQKATAMTLQQSLLPAALPEAPGVEWAACYRPAGEGLEVGGDFYDVFPAVGDGRIAVVIGDVSGKGVDAATVTSLTRHTARAVTMYDVIPSHVLSQLNHAIIQQGKGLFVTAIFACLNPADGAGAGRLLTFACGGHLPPLLLRPNGVVEALGQPGMILGYFPDPQFPDCEASLLPGDLVLFYTDGVTEARRQRELYGEERLTALLASCRGLDPRQVVERIEHAALDFQDGRPRDDIAILALRISPVREAAGESFEQD